MSYKDIRCGGCHYTSCLAKKYTELIDKCECVTCILKPMCRKFCEERRYLYSTISDERKMELETLRIYRGFSNG